MFIDYLFSSPQGDILLRPEDLARPFLLGPSEPHPFLTLRHYFEAIQTFLLGDEEKCLMNILRTKRIGEKGRDRIKRIGIRSEKHGVLYHVASVEILFDKRPIKLAVSTAVSDQGKACLANEYDILTSLCRSLRRPYLPEVYIKGDVICQYGGHHRETLVLMLSEWLEGFHEWHLSIDAKDNRQKVCIWDLETGYRHVREEEAFEIFRQASIILTLCYDTRSFKQVYPWHHAAGDFVVKAADDGVHVKLTTARDYRSIMDFFSKDAVDPLIAMVYFFLNLTIRMRLDRLNGVGETVWAGDFSLYAAVKGFFEGLRMMEEEGTVKPGQIVELLSLLQSLNEDELERLLEPLLDFHQEESPVDLSVIQANIKSHTTLLCQTLQGFRI